ncbi:MAG: 23S rRNA (pseudouridine(1915)-N(3))-methyltransferase RlmH [Bacteroidales bacterium]|jgi:23S rRNA (pseudouridine1915-N3)-methyltransferase|nr:23S rRNA (pseudouridine(1915)-N(3))-methyltransferase RlmH [Bacteroidales bacterium]
MKIKLLYVGKEDAGVFQEALQQYVDKMQHYIGFSIENIPYIKNSGKSLSVEQQKTKEGVLMMKKIEPMDIVILLDERGKEYTSVGLAQFIERKQVSGTKSLVFIIGGPFGFSQEVYERANEKLSLSKLTFPHIMSRVLFLEQLYRAFSILRNEAYHHE